MFQEKKRYSPLMFRKMEWIVGYSYDSYLLRKVKSAFTLYSFSDGRYSSLNFLIFENTFYVQEDAVAPPNVEVETTSILRRSGRM